jgi:hypothetical protein
MEYYVSVSCDNASKGVFTDYSLTIGGDRYDSLYSDISDNVLSDDLNPLALRTGSAVDAATGSYLKTVTVDGWVGYGDPTDMMPFIVTTPGNWSVRLQADLGQSVSLKLQNVIVDPDTGGYKYTDVAAGKADAKGSINLNAMLQSGTYVLTVAVSDQKTDKSNTSYTLTLDETGKFATLNTLSGTVFTMERGETRTFTLSSVQQISLNKTSDLSLWTGDGKNGKTAVKLAYNKETKTYDATLTPGMYFLTASKLVYDVCITGSYPDGYGSSMFTDDNTFATASTFLGYASSFVGYGDGVDIYKYTIGDGLSAPGSYSLTLSDAVSDYVSVTAYMKTENKGKAVYKQIGKFDHKEGKETSITLNDLIDGEYYIRVESKAYAAAANSKDTTYELSFNATGTFGEVAMDIPLKDPACVLAKGEYAYYRGEGDGSGSVLYRVNARVANGYEVYVNNGDGKLTKLKVGSNNAFILRDDQMFYVKSTKDGKDFSQGISITAEELPEAGSWYEPYMSKAGSDNLQLLCHDDGKGGIGWQGWIGCDEASTSLEFGTGLLGNVEAGWATFEITSIERSIEGSSAVKFGLALEKCDNGVWKKVASTAAQSSYDKKSGTCKLTGTALNAELEDDMNYRLTVSAASGNGESSGKFVVNGAIDVFDRTDNTLASPKLLTGDTEATVVKKHDDFDIYELVDLDRFYLDADSGSVKLTFYDENYDPVALSGKYSTDTHGALTGALTKGNSVTLTAGDAKMDGIKLSSSDLLEYGIRFAKVEAAGKANNHYRIFVGNLG